MNQTCRVEMLGRLSMTVDDQVIARFRTQKTARLLAYLSYYLKRSHAREELVELLWPDTEPEAGRTSLRTVLASLRRQLEPPGTPANSVLIADRTHIYLNTELVGTDVSAFETCLRDARHATEADTQMHQLVQAVALYRGPLLPGYYDDWILRERERLEQAYATALQHLTALLEQSGEFSQAIQYAQKSIAVDPLQEEAHILLIRLYAKSGQRTAAIRQYSELKRLLQSELGQGPARETQFLVEQILQEPYTKTSALYPVSLPERAAEKSVQAEAPANPVIAAEPVMPPTPSLPVPLTRIFGREEELKRLQSVLTSGEHRLITLTGPGGAGKTRLAIEIARNVCAAFNQRVYYVPLADISDSSLIVRKILDSMGIVSSSEVVLMTQAEMALSCAPALIVLDNFEHLEEGGATVVWEMLQHIPSLSCLITSRHRLNLGGEREFPVAFLPVPTLTDTPESLMEYASIRLFVDRAQASRPDFQVSRENAATISAICERLEGIPLAIELAAAWVGALTLTQMLSRLENRFELLTSRRVDLPSRHRTLRATVEWSYRLLTPPLQRFLTHLSVFQGGWTLEAAESVCEEPDALSALQQLQERSFVLAEETVTGMSFRLLETIRQYVDELLPEEEREALQRRHLQFFCALAVEAAPNLHGPEQKQWMDKIDHAHDNIRVALQRSQQKPDFLFEGLRMATGIHFFWSVRGHHAEGYRWHTDLLARAETVQDVEGPLNQPEGRWLRTEALLGAGELACVAGDMRRAKGHFEQYLNMRRAEDYPAGVAYARCYLGITLEALGETLQAKALFQQSLAEWQQIGSPGGIAHTLTCLAGNVRKHGDLKRARQLLEEGLAIYREIGNVRGITMILCEMTDLLIEQREFRQAEALLQECHVQSHELKDTGNSLRVLWNLGHLSRRRCDYTAARTQYEECLTILHRLGDQHNIVGTLNYLGQTAKEQGDFRAAHAYLTEGIALARRILAMERVAMLLHEQGKVYEEQGDLASAQTKYTECLEIYSEKGDRYGIASLFSAMAHVKMEQNLDAQAQELYQQSLDIFRSLGIKQGTAFSLYGVGEVFYRQKDRTQARSLWTECLSMDMEAGIRGSKALNALGELAVVEGDYEEATRLWNMSHAEAQKIGDPLRILDSLEGLLSVAMAQKEYDRAASLVAMCEALLSQLNTSVPIRKRQAIEKARAMLRTELGEELFEEAMDDEQETLL